MLVGLAHVASGLHGRHEVQCRHREIHPLRHVNERSQDFFLLPP
jgi:hypothetical protein